jgi:hypothetical protein
MPLYLEALQKCKDELRAAFASLAGDLQTNAAVSDQLLEQFVAGFEKDFKSALTEADGTDSPAAWQLTRTQLMLKVRAIAALALSYAVIANRTAVELDDLIRALHQVKPDCEVTTAPARRQRLDYCAGAWTVQVQR